METKIQTVAKVNKVDILLIQDAEKLIPIKPICEALGIDHKNQRTKIYEDDLLNSVGVLSTSTGADGKTYEMFCIPYKYVFGWLFTINPNRVKPEAQEAVRRYRSECYDALYNHFTEYSSFIEQKSAAIEEKLTLYRKLQDDFKNARTCMEEAKKQLDDVRKLHIDEWRANSRQIEIKFE